MLTGQVKSAGQDMVSVNKTILDQSPDGFEAIPPGVDLFTLLEFAPVIRNGHLVDSMPALEHLGCHLWLEVEAPSAQGDITNDPGTKTFVTRLHVTQDGVVQNVGYQRQKAIAEHAHPIRLP